jgi:SOS-response transcriptional repressor LexA
MTTTDNLGINYLKNFENLMFGQRVAYVIETSGLSKAWIAEKLGISKQALNYLLKHSINPKFVDEFAELLKLDPKWLETGEGSPSIRTKETQQPSSTAIPIITKAELLTPTKRTNQSRETIDFSRGDAETFTAYKLEDDSNFPPFIEGSILIFDTKKQPENESFVLSIIENDVFVRQYLVDGDNICYKAGNGGHKTFINPKATLVGVLVEARYQIS